MDDIDGEIPVGFCELCGLPLFEGDDFDQDEEGILTCIQCPEAPEPPELLPCPFCGGKASYGSSTSRCGDEAPETTVYASCANCGGKVTGIFGGYATHEAAADRWNNRVNS